MDNLILQIQQDNEHAFKQFYQAYYIKVVTFITGIIKKHDIAEDLAQDVFVNLWINRKTLDNCLSCKCSHLSLYLLEKETSEFHSWFV